MPLTGQAKTDYQRDYMRRRRSNAGSNTKPESVRPRRHVTVRPSEHSFDAGIVSPPIPLKREPVIERPPGLSENQWAYMKYRAGKA